MNVCDEEVYNPPNGILLNHQSSDKDLILQLQTGNRMAFSILYDRYADSLYYFFMKLFFNDSEKSRDFVQDIFVKIIEKPALLNPEKNLKAWFFTSANNMAKNEYRHIEVKNRHANQVDASEAIETTSEVKLNQEFRKKELMLGLKQLKPSEQSLLILRFKEEFSIKEIAEIENIPEGTVKSRIHHSLKKVSAYLSHLNDNT